MNYVGKNQEILNRWRKAYVEKNQVLYPNCPNLGDYFAPDGIMYKGDIVKETAHCDNKTSFF